MLNFFNQSFFVFHGELNLPHPSQPLTWREGFIKFYEIQDRAYQPVTCSEAFQTTSNMFSNPFTAKPAFNHIAKSLLMCVFSSYAAKTSADFPSTTHKRILTEFVFLSSATELNFLKQSAFVFEKG